MTFDGRIEALVNVPASVTMTATNSVGGPTVITLTPGSYYPPQLVAQLVADLNSQQPSGWSGSISTGASGTLQTTLNCSSTPFSIVWTSTTLRDLLGFTVDILTAGTAQTGTKQTRGMWMPDCPFLCEDDPRQAPKVSDLRTTMSPTGQVLGLVGNILYRHQNARWEAVPIERKREASAVLANASWEYFFNETQLGQGSSWFTPSSKIRIYDHTGALVGGDANAGAGVAGWWITGVTSIEPKQLVAGWTGRWTIAIPELVSSG